MRCWRYTEDGKALRKLCRKHFEVRLGYPYFGNRLEKVNTQLKSAMQKAVSARKGMECINIGKTQEFLRRQGRKERVKIQTVG
jgi:hypothetical protein